jgi:NurA-like 5'-3' nuclease
MDRGDIILVRGDVNPIADSLHPRSAMSSKAALGHELGHAAHRGTKLHIGAWNDEFRASYWAAKNLPHLSEQDRIHLILDAMERAKEAGVSISPNALMRKILYGY